MENFTKEKVNPSAVRRGLVRRLLALAVAAALALSLAACDGSAVLPGGSAGVTPDHSVSQTGTEQSFAAHFIDVG